MRLPFSVIEQKDFDAVGFGLNARGAMEIILATLALNAGLIGDKIFVGLVIMALVTSLSSGPLMKKYID
jgi:Kef-type K+ transport system membrane component KefB